MLLTDVFRHYNQQHQQDQKFGYTDSSTKHHDKEIGKHTKERVQEELAKTLEESHTYTKFQLLEIFTSVDFEKAKKLLTDTDCEDILVSMSQTPVLLEDSEQVLTLEDLRPKKGMGGPRKRSKFYY